MKKIITLVLTALLLGISGTAWAVGQSFPTSVSVVAPTTVSMSLIWWSGRTATGNEINFSLGAAGTPTLGKTSWVDTDDFTSLDGNVGFTASCTGPVGSTLTIACGKMTDGAGHSIPYQSIDGLTDYFGFSAKLEDNSYIAGSPTSMQLHSLAGWSNTFGGGVYGHDYAIYNLLKIPTSIPVGTYATTGSGDYQHLTLTFI